MAPLKTVLISCLLIGLVAADDRQKRQAYGGQYAGAAAYRQPQGYQQQQQQQQQQAYGHQPQYAPQQPVQRPHKQHAQSVEEEEKEEGPHPLTLLLENSKFDCGGKSDGYYADSGVGCQAFHYCVSGQKHSMMCPAGTVFHQVHLNCVPQDQDICNKADKFFFVNDYLNKPLEQKGPNNTVVYAQRYYPENYANGDPFIPPHDGNREPPAATYGLGPAYREQQPGPVHQAHRPQQAHAPAHHAQSPAAYARPQPAPAVHHPQPAPLAHRPQPVPVAHRPQPAPYAPPQAYQPRPVQPAPHQQPHVYGYGAEQAQAHLAQAQQAQRAYAQQQYQALAPQQQLYGAGAAQRPRYPQQY